ncbi:MAG TPA: hypothetical protein VGO04_17910 [Ensifer sp.]|jgi:hypothetical protein|uniref:hypothetical protein n=1 Tax=Ensifer sp. TaxID=1872086 RepID=UPI002E0DA4EE|nr:hypothetical protein [Ensifer sp.]
MATRSRNELLQHRLEIATAVDLTGDVAERQYPGLLIQNVSPLDIYQPTMRPAKAKVYSASAKSRRTSSDEMEEAPSDDPARVRSNPNKRKRQIK